MWAGTRDQHAVFDHFQPPLKPARHWESFYSAWCASLMRVLNEWLPEGYFAEADTQVGGRIEVDVATWRMEEATGQTGSRL
jgi:hypothetical protein